MRTTKNATNNLKEFNQRTNLVLTNEDLINIFNMLPLFLKDNIDNITNEILDNSMDNKPKDKTNLDNENIDEENNVKEIDDALIVSIKDLRDKLGRMPKMEDIKNAKNIDLEEISNIGWRNIKNHIKEEDLSNKEPKKRGRKPYSENEIIMLEKELKRIPTMNDIKEHNIDITPYVEKYGNWKQVKAALHLNNIYEKILREQLLELKKTKKLTKANCDASNIDTLYLIKAYGGSWKRALKELKVL